MAPPATLLADMSQRGQYVCRSCLGSLRTTQHRPTARTTTRPPWATGTAANTPALTTTIPIRTLSRSATQVRGRARREGGAAPSSRRATPPRAQAEASSSSSSSINTPPAGLPTVEELRRGLEADTEANRIGRTDDEVSVRFFDQLLDGTIVPVNDPRSVESELTRKMDELEGKLKDSEKLIKEIEKKHPDGPIKRRADRMRRRLDIIREVEAEGRKVELEEAEAAKSADKTTPTPASIKISEMGFHANARRHVRNLNAVLRPAAARLKLNGDKGIDTKIITAVWSRYGAARIGLAESWSNVPPAAWALLWDVLARDSSAGVNCKNPRRMSHIFYLTKDMQAAGITLTDEQQILAIEAMFIEGWQAEAIDNWRRVAATLGAQPSTALAYWELGVRMNSIEGDLERAERAADHLFDGGLAKDGCKDKPNPRVLFQLIRSAASRDAQAKAWETYRRLHTILEARGPGGMKIEDYDEVVSAFLAANQTEYAFDVFVDMMFSGAIDSRQRLHVQEQNDQRHDKYATPKLPQPVANQFFFGKWLKRLIGAGDTDGAHRVLKFMQSRGIMMAAVQVNGLLGAWLRSGTAENQALADTLAWQMIESRRIFVSLRRRERQVEWPLQLQSNRTRNGLAVDANSELTFVPRASLETFLLMADNYKNRGQIGMMEKLWTAFRDCELSSTDAYMMNQLIESYMRDGRADEARNLYRHMVHGPQKVLPNANTFISLVRSVPVNRGIAATMSDDELQVAGNECRKLVAEMTRVAHVAFRNSSGKPRETVDPREAAYYQALGRSLLHTFRKTGDYVALYVMLQTMLPLMSTADAFRVPRFRMTSSLAIELVSGLSSTDNKYYQRDTAETRHRIFKASEAVESLLREARMGQLNLYRQPERPRRALTSSGVQSDLDLSDDLSAAVAHVYRIKCKGVTEDQFAAMHDAAVAEMGLQKYFNM
ncbi:pentatricopeptide repeat domain-containing protein [Ophiostoma piceae UAMH 11346]|uniref:Pentatricopeptide repeat domain-containing protein n=1 Tax=Ophiostoma piceae (strain UAMH 11346) TaxID=1262450 RepID=S3BYF0_OPHP1|nr:pentatricopeptide repeat domain-containing protein [Ophiostoma piceae UAMH 11346]